MMVEPLCLYRAILRLGRRQLKLTDQDFFRRTVRAEFKKYKYENSAEEVVFQIEVSARVDDAVPNYVTQQIVAWVSGCYDNFY